MSMNRPVPAFVEGFDLLTRTIRSVCFPFLLLLLNPDFPALRGPKSQNLSAHVVLWPLEWPHCWPDCVTVPWLPFTVFFFFLLGLQFLFLECSTRTSTTNGICVTPWLGWITGDLLAEGPSSQSPQHQKKIERPLFTRNKVVTMVDTIKQDFRRVFPCGISCPPSNCVCRHIATKKIQWLSKNAAESSVGGRKKKLHEISKLSMWPG